MSPHAFYLTKGIVAMVTVIFVVIHMQRSWSDFDREDGIRTGVSQRMRYISWFLFIILVAAASRDQLEQNAAILRRNVAALGVVAFALLTAVVSIVETVRKSHRRH